jgi:hypothetical protein
MQVDVYMLHVTWTGNLPTYLPHVNAALGKGTHVKKYTLDPPGHEIFIIQDHQVP